MKKSKKGFTIVELVIVIAIIGLLAAITVPGLTGQIRSAQLRSDKETASMLSDLCKRAAMDNTINSGRDGYAAIQLVYDDASDNTVFGQNDVTIDSVVPQTPGAVLVYNPSTYTVELRQSGEEIGSGWEVLVDADGTVNELPLKS